jgi:nucleoside-diphosphate-sugar epimerase
LVYGPAQRGNLARMVHAVAHGRFPPIPETGNRRSMLHVEDAVSALLLAARHATARDQIYIVTDARAYSTREILNQIHLAFGHPVPTWSIPRTLLSAIATAGSVLGAATGARMPLTRDALDKLLGSAWYSSEKIRRELGFSSRYDFATALPDIVRWYNEHGMPKNTEHREGWLE